MASILLEVKREFNVNYVFKYYFRVFGGKKQHDWNFEGGCMTQGRKIQQKVGCDLWQREEGRIGDKSFEKKIRRL